MEEIISTLLNSNNAISIICGTVVYLIIYFQRKNTRHTKKQRIQRNENRMCFAQTTHRSR